MLLYQNIGIFPINFTEVLQQDIGRKVKWSLSALLGPEKTGSVLQCAFVKVVAEELKSRGQLGEVYISLSLSLSLSLPFKE